MNTRTDTAELKYLYDKITESPVQNATEVSYRIDPPLVTPHQLKVDLHIENITFDRLTELLIETEHREGMSTLEMFRRYIREDRIHSENIEEWFDLFFLYLGAKEVKQYSHL